MALKFHCEGIEKNKNEMKRRRPGQEADLRGSTKVLPSTDCVQMRNAIPRCDQSAHKGANDPYKFRYLIQTNWWKRKAFPEGYGDVTFNGTTVYSRYCINYTD